MAAVEFAAREGITEQYEFWEDVEEEENGDMAFVDPDKVAGGFEETAPADSACVFYGSLVCCRRI